MGIVLRCGSQGTRWRAEYTPIGTYYTSDRAECERTNVSKRITPHDALSLGGIPWQVDREEAAGCFPAKHQSFKGKARDRDPGFLIYEARGGEASCSLCG